MYGTFNYIWLIVMVNVGKYTMHGRYGIGVEITPFITICWGCISCMRLLEAGHRAVRVQPRAIQSKCASNPDQHPNTAWMSQEVSKWLVNGL